MPKNKPYSVYAEGADGMKPGTTVDVVGQGVIQKDGTVRVDRFQAEGGPNTADKAMGDLVGDRTGRPADGVMGDGADY